MRMPYTMLLPDYYNQSLTFEWCDSTSCASCNEAWGYWTTPGTTAYSYGTTSSAATDVVWNGWATWPGTFVLRDNEVVVRRTRNNVYQSLQAEEVPETDEEKAARLERTRVREEAQRVEAARIAEVRKVATAKATAAHERAKELLMSQLSDSQRKQYHRDCAFTVVGVSGRRYLIREGWAGNVDELDANGKAFNRLCIHPTIGVPTPDNMLVQKLMLDTDEEQFRRTANHTRLAV